MEYVVKNVNVNVKDYEYVVSLGNKCPTTIILRDLGVYKESFPFDYIPTTPALILKYLQDQSDFFPSRGVVRTKDQVWFGHFDISKGYPDTVTTFKRRFERLFGILKEKKRILFVYTSEADVYNEMGNRYNDNYGALVQIKDYLENTYGYSDFLFVAIHTNKTFPDTPNIINFEIRVPDHFCSDDMSTHHSSITSIYRSKLKELLRRIFFPA